MKPTLLFVFILFSYFSYSQSPGGIQANNTLWLRSDVGVASAANIVSGWKRSIRVQMLPGNFTVQALQAPPMQAGQTYLEPSISIHISGLTGSIIHSQSEYFSALPLLTIAMLRFSRL